MSTATFGLGFKLLKRLCEEQSTLKWYRAKLIPEMFRPGEQEVLEWVNNHVVKHHVLPQPETLFSMFSDISQFPTPEPSSYYLEHVENRLYYEKINQANIASQKVLKESSGDYQKAMQCMTETLSFIAGHRYRQRIVDLAKEGPKMVMDAYHNVLNSELAGTFGWKHMDESGGGMMPGDVITFIGRPASGKAQPLTSKVLTVDGFKFMGDIQVGDKLASVDGQPSVVTGVFPQGKKPVFTLTFQDGRTVEASDEHLWEVHYRDWDAPKVETTLQLIARLKHQRYQNRLSISLFSGEFGQQVKSPFSAYLLGVFLGDGCLRSGTPSLTSVDPEIISRIGSELAVLGLELSAGWGRGGIQYSASDTRMGTCAQENRLRKWFKDLGVWGLKSEHKHIPAQYLESDRETRVQLLQGLMDTDGTAGKNGGVSFSSSSKTLAEQVQYLVRSLGGKASLSMKKTSCLDHWVVHIVAKDRDSLFGLARKKARVLAPRTTHTNHRLTLTGIEYLGDDECQCIQVSHPTHLYVSDDFVVTHNTFMLLRMALHNWTKGHRPLVVSMEMSPLPLIQRLTAMYAHTNIGQLKVGGYSSQTYQKFVGSMLELAGGKSGFYVVDGNLAASVDDIYTLALQLKCDQVYIDGAYLLKHPNSRLDRYTKVAENVELIKQRTTDLEIPTIASYQFARTAKKSVKGFKGAASPSEEAGLEDIAFSDAIGQISSIVLGLFQEESVETLEKRKIRVMKGRSGEVGSFDIHWDFNSLNFSQIGDDEEPEPSLAQLQYI
jgi:replicative DNA helicase